MWTRYPEISAELELAEELIMKNIKSRNKLLSKVVGELIGAGGKRLRPAMVILSSRFGSYDREKILHMAGAIEILHTATLVHDDIIDRSKIRRGRVTVAEKYGPDMALYTGDFLFTKAILMLSSGISTENLDMMAKAIKTICEGEVDQFQDRFNIDTTVLGYLKRISRKTAVLFGTACGAGARLAGCHEETSRRLTRFGLYYGMAFQIRDDLNDFLSDAEASGKPVIKDILEGVITLPVIYGLKRNKTIKEMLGKFVGTRENAVQEQLEDIAALVRKSKGLEDAGYLLQKYIDKGIKIIQPLPDNEYKEVLIQLIKGLSV